MENLTKSQSKALEALKKVGGSVQREAKFNVRARSFFGGKLVLASGPESAYWTFPGFNRRVLQNLVEKGLVQHEWVTYEQSDNKRIQELEKDRKWIVRAYQGLENETLDSLGARFVQRWTLKSQAEEPAESNPIKALDDMFDSLKLGKPFKTP